MNKRKKTLIDGMDKEIIRTLYNNEMALTGFQIAKDVGLSRSAIRPRLNNLRDKGIIKTVKTAGIRKYNREYPDKKNPKKKRTVKIKASRSIYWGLDLID